MNTISFSRKELEDFALQVLGVRRTALRRMSTMILAQLLKLKLNDQCAADEMVELVRCLEGQNGQAIRSGYLRNVDLPGCKDARVVYKRINGNNYYLTLAGKKDGQQHINQRLLDACRFDFPFLEDNGQPVHYSNQILQGEPGPLLTAA
ncbi:MAG: hypothetical protein PVI54_06505 [Desulfobacteraceae bacterium]|jgi:hypothetical protein